MSVRRHKADPAPAPLCASESVQLMRFGAKLYDEYCGGTPSPSVHEIRLTRFGDYLHHFGFTLQATRAYDSMTTSAPAGVEGAQMGGRLGQATRSCVVPGVRSGVGTMSGDNGGDEWMSDWRPSAEDLAEADAQAIAAGDLCGVTKADEVAALLVAPFTRTSWRQNGRQCALKKARCLYMWLCRQVHVTLNPEVDPREVARQAVNDSAVTVPAVVKAEKRRPAGRKAAAGAQPAQAQSPPSAVSEEAIKPKDPIAAVLETRRATPRMTAELFQVLGRCAGLDVELVKGWLKHRDDGDDESDGGGGGGDGKEGAVTWYWNIVRIEGRASLVDVAASVYAGPWGRTVTQQVAGGPDDATTTAAVAATSSAEKTNTMGKKERRPRRGVDVGSVHDDAIAEPGAVSVEEMISTWSLTKPFTLRQPRRRVEDFYFFTNPQHFITTHLAEDEGQTLLAMPPTRGAWDAAPCLTHDFYRFHVHLVSHHRNAFSVRSTPFYVSVRNDDPASTELCCVLYHEPLNTSREDGDGGDRAARRTSVALGPEWVWHERRESDSCETFTLLVPEGGVYRVVLGARAIRSDPYSAVISRPDGAFTPIVSYQVKVNMALLTTPVLPRRHLSPCIAKLVCPASCQVSAGLQRFCVIPSCSNVVAVAVVALRKAPQTSFEREASTSAGQASAQFAQTGTVDAQPARRILCFLPFDLHSLCYSGDVDLRAGEEVELWIRYGAPDCNGRSFEEKVSIEAKEQPSLPVSTQPDPPRKTQAAGGKGRARRNDALTTTTSAEEKERARLSRLSLYGHTFMPFVTGISVRHHLAKEAENIIQPRLDARAEKAGTLRRLIAVTPTLFDEVTRLEMDQQRAVGSFFDASVAT